MKATELNQEYWQNRYENQQTGWDIGYASTPLVEYFDALENKNLRILIPGAGNAYAAAYLHQIGFENVTIVDFAQQPLDAFAEKHPDFDSKKLMIGDFFEHKGEYDLVVEQTFFCAIHPSLREQYVEHMSNLLAPKGKICGLLWKVPMNNDRPPYGGNTDEYQQLFESKFNILRMQDAKNSIAPRQGTEVFVELELKD